MLFNWLLLLLIVLLVYCGVGRFCFILFGLLKVFVCLSVLCYCGLAVCLFVGCSGFG